MPVVKVQITRDGVSREHKAQIIHGMTQVLVDVLGKRPEHTHVIIEEIDTDNWGFAGVPTTEYRKKVPPTTG